MQSFDFFFEHAGYSYKPSAESEFAGRVRCALDLAAAEAWADETDCTYDWDIDPFSDSSDWTDEEPAWQVWDCVMRDSAGKVIASLGSIDFGRDGEPWGSPYRRVVEAELASEVMP